ncbi:MAG: tyrosine-type recombinase/integrase [Candidatus Thorarchaeota archaeon]|jgi:site-specific recombinase XerD
MKNFESFLSPMLNEYLLYRQNLGYNIKVLRSHLRIFDHYLRETNVRWESLNPFFFLEMRTHLYLEAVSVNKVITALRSFYKFLIRKGYVEENPLRDIPLLKENTIVPFIFSPEQTSLLLSAVCKTIQRKQRTFLTELSTYLAIVLLARCGMRISEPLKLHLRHYRRDDATLYIEKTKFKKDRLIPIPKAVATQIDNYLSVRQSLQPDNNNIFLLAGKGVKPLTDNRVRYIFHQAVKQIGIRHPRKVMGNMTFNPPTPHSLRHSFAINTLIAIKQRGQSTQNALPVLSQFLGHSNYMYTAIYLKAADAKSRKDLFDFTPWKR